MAEILPEPVDDDIIVSSQPIKQTKVRSQKKPHNKRTLWFMVSLVVIAVVCIFSAFGYQYFHYKSQDNTRKNDLGYIYNVLNTDDELNGSYPTLSQLNSSDFGTFAPSLNRQKFMTPDSTSTVLVASPSDSNYAYIPAPSNCNGDGLKCSSYELIAVLNDGSEYILYSPSKN